MFSYRHAFHAGNHADVLKHTVLIAVLDYLLQKETALTVFDTHAGAGLYRLDGDYAGTSGEAAEGILRLVARSQAANAAADVAELAPALARYLDVVRAFNAPGGELRIYPGSPFIAHHLLRPQDRLKLCELHPTDARVLQANVGQLGADRRITARREDGFSCTSRFLPPPGRRALVLCDPSYEIKTDYARTAHFIAEALRRFATGCYVIWYPIIPRPEAHALPRRLKTLANQAGRSWLQATLTVKTGRHHTALAIGERSSGLPASGVFLINPPYTLKPQLAAALPQLVRLLGQDRSASFVLDGSASA